MDTSASEAVIVMHIEAVTALGLAIIGLAAVYMGVRWVRMMFF